MKNACIRGKIVLWQLWFLSDIQHSFFLAGEVRKSKFGVVVGGAVGGALLALSIGVIFVYWNCRVKGAKHNDVFVDVAGILPTSLSCKFPEEKKIHIQILCYYQVA